MDWITGRNPDRAELLPVFRRGAYVVYGQDFLVSYRGAVDIARFTMPPNGDGWYPGYWTMPGHRTEPDAWQPLPAPWVPGDKTTGARGNG